MKKVIIAGGSGFIGQLLTKYYTEQNYEVIIFSRHHKVNSENVKYYKWDAKNLGYWVDTLENSELLINLNGKSVDCRYTDKNKEKIYDTRINATYVLGKAIENLKNPPKLWINASSATIYKHSLEQAMDEENGVIGDGFSVDVVKKWEETFFSFTNEKTRKVALRIAIVLGKDGGALQPLVGLTKLFAGGQHGNGKQMFSWIHEKDLVEVISFIENNNQIEGVINVSSPEPIRNKVLMKYLRSILKRKIGLPMPKWMLSIGARIIKTETELLLKSRYVIPKNLIKHGYSFKFSRIDNALNDLLK